MTELNDGAGLGLQWKTPAPVFLVFLNPCVYSLRGNKKLAMDCFQTSMAVHHKQNHYRKITSSYNNHTL